MIYRALENGTERLQAGALAQSGDRVQIVYRSGGMPYGAILSVDGRGAFTQHLPLKGEVAVPLVARDTLDFAYELDDAPHWERFYLAVAERRFELEELRTQLARGSSRELSTGIRLFEFTLKKLSLKENMIKFLSKLLKVNSLKQSMEKELITQLIISKETLRS